MPGKKAPRQPWPLATDGRDLWERQPHESGRAFSAFCAYRDLGPTRTIAETARRLGKHPKTLEDHGCRQSWKIRIAAYDKHMHDIAMAAQEEERREAQKRHIQLARLMQGVGGKALEAMFAKVRLDPAAAEQVPPQEMRLLSETGLKLERLLIGEPGERTEVKVEAVDPSTDKAYHAALAKVANALGLKPEDIE
jgi:hypothetical protein